MMAAGAEGGVVLEKAADNDATSTGTNTEPEEEEEEESEGKVRDFFPETWLWKIKETGSNGKKTWTETAPDTITSWIVKAFAFNGESGLGVADKTNLTVFQEIFVDMNLPYSVVRGEVFTLQLLVFNHKNTELAIDVELTEEPALFEVIVESDETKSKLLKQTLKVSAGSSAMMEVPIKPRKLGDVNLTATATSGNFRDTVIKPILVKPEGLAVDVSKGFKPVSFPAAESSFDVDANYFFKGNELVEDSLRMYLHASGDTNAAFRQNVNGDVGIPMGCGEQNMITVVPAVFVAMYYTAIDQFDAEIKAKCSRYAALGYARELNYKHTNISQDDFGGYSAFGEPAEGSTWLTAFVLKVFALLAKTDLAYVSRVPLQQAFTFLNKRWNADTDKADSFFIENGRVLHSEMQGGTSAGIGLSAFCLGAIMDYKDLVKQDGGDVTDINNVLDLGLKWLEDNLMDVNTKFQQAMTAVTFARAQISFPNRNYYDKAKTLMAEFEKPRNTTGKKECPYVSGHDRAICFAKKEDLRPVEPECEAPEDCQTAGNEDQLCCLEPCTRRKVCKMGVVPRPPTSAGNTEMKGYSIIAYSYLTHLTDKKTNPADYEAFKMKATKAADELIEMRSAGGRFGSTQDTSVGLEALARYGILIPSSSQTDFKLRVKYKNNPVTEWISFDNTNFFVTRTEKIEIGTTRPDAPLTVETSGTAGKADILVQALYNVQKGGVMKDGDTSLEVEIKTYTDIKKQHIVEACFHNADTNNQISSMVIYEVMAGSGNTIKCDGSSPDISRMESGPGDRSAVAYYEKGDDNFSRKRCHKCVVEERFEVKNRAHAVATAKDYYNLENVQEVLFAEDFTNQEQGGTTPTTGCSHAQMNLLLLLVAVAWALFYKE